MQPPAAERELAQNGRCRVVAALVPATRAAAAAAAACAAHDEDGGDKGGEDGETTEDAADDGVDVDGVAFDAGGGRGIR